MSTLSRAINSDEVIKNMMFDSEAFKKQFPLFSHPENSELAYLDNAATTQRPQVVVDAITDFYTRYNANTHRSSHRLARQATEMVECVREQLSRFVNARRVEEIIFTRGATESLNILARSIGETLSAGDEVVLSSAEHHANLVPWQMLAETKGVVLRFVAEIDGEPQLDALSEVLNERTRVVSLTAASNALGFRLPIAQVKHQLPEQCVLIVDACQVLSHDLIDVQALGCDFLVGSAHKFYGPTGVGFLYGNFERLSSLPPALGGGEMITRVELEGSQYAAPPHRFEPGTSSLAAIAGLGACLTFLEQQDRAGMTTYESHLNRYLHTELNSLCLSLPLQLITRFENNVGVAAIITKPESALSVADIGAWLDEKDIAVRVGHHCAQPLMTGLGFEGSLRVSLAPYNNREDIDRLITALREMPFHTHRESQKITDQHSDVMSGDSVGLEEDLWVRDSLQGVVLEQLSEQGTWQKRYRQLTRWAECLKPKPEIREEANRVVGCESEVWMTHRQTEQGHQFLIDTDSRVIKGLSVLLLLLVNNKCSDDISALDFEGTFEGLGLQKYLSPSRTNGFRALVDRVIFLSSS